MKQIQDAAGQIAGFGARLLIVLQDLGQLKELYKDRWETFVGNSGTLLFFANNDLASLEFVSKRLGTTSFLVSQTSAVSFEAAGKGERGLSSSLQVHDLLTPEEFSRYFGRGTDRLLVIHAGDDPMAIELVKYDTHVFFKGRWDQWQIGPR
jgi:type IV secretion system protein VirD4